MIADEALAVRPEVATGIRLYDFNMMDVIRKKFTGNKTTLNVSNLPDGLYILQILIDGNKYEFVNTTDERAKQFNGNKTYWEKVQIRHQAAYSFISIAD